MEQIQFTQAATVTGKDLRQLGYPEGKVIGMALQLMEKIVTTQTREETLQLLSLLLAQPAAYLAHAELKDLAEALIQKPSDTLSLVAQKEYQIYGAEAIEAGAVKQMQVAMKLPITLGGALMPDAHPGYGLPIGGVLATRNAVIPYGVGVDIGCRMCMTLYDLPVSLLDEKKEDFKKLLLNNTQFGTATFKKPLDNAIFERKEFLEIAIVKGLKDKAYKQIGSSGGGNHFVEFGIVELLSAANEFALPAGQYLAVLSHSGSRGMGAAIAAHYTKVAMEACKLPQEAKHLAWLDLDSEAGAEYWQAMNLAGDYASACHHQIHQRLAVGLRATPLTMIENHHNFAWKEKDATGNEIIVHRKGATPAGKGVLGIIPGSMASPGFIVRGKGEPQALNSASHGAGRVLSRTKAKETLNKKTVAAHLLQAGVELLGSGLDEAPMVYKDIHQVMAYQQDLVDVLGTFMPRIVRMCGDERFQEVD
ncbi:RtcB family protein [Rhodocytophaga aerolata]|uniref:3'-phosphate/5'-hydroxy nucleic acid ligase n=1 Tax=Rhodocytophaga aerolata TaxID=455078 RepID=A0ABT8R8I4_9BACT|nr:RtcB family protein [Rhodocytophaga aerolata]MDO1448411.1 RtcB family protein [Rhodocytophaga aerolata]